MRKLAWCTSCVTRESAGARNAASARRKGHSELHPDVVAEAKRLPRASPKTGERMSYRKISNQLAAAGFVNERGQLFNPKSIKAMLDQPASDATKYKLLAC